MPVLSVDGVKLCQSNTIALFLAHEFGLAGKSNIDFARVSMIMDCVSDAIKNVYPSFFEQDPQKKASDVKCPLFTYDYLRFKVTRC